MTNAKGLENDTGWGCKGLTTLPLKSKRAQCLFGSQYHTIKNGTWIWDFSLSALSPLSMFPDGSSTENTKANMHTEESWLAFLCNSLGSLHPGGSVSVLFGLCYGLTCLKTIEHLMPLQSRKLQIGVSIDVLILKGAPILGDL